MCEQDTSTNALTESKEWLNQYARINVVRNIQFARQWIDFSERGVSFEDSIGRFAIRGGSKDSPTPYLYYCHKTPGCTYSSAVKQHVDDHGILCNDILVATTLLNAGQETYLCPEADCDFETRTSKQALEEHLKHQHKFKARACPHGCNDNVVYTTASSYQTHMRKYHREGWPAKCLFPDCEHTTKYSDENTLMRHLAVVHLITDKTEQIKYFPPLPQRQRSLLMTCNQGAKCDTKPYTSTSASRVRQHLVTVHKMSEPDSQAWIDAHQQFEWYTPDRVVYDKPIVKTRKRKTADQVENDSNDNVV